jgi:hypothetical protein
MIVDSDPGTAVGQDIPDEDDPGIFGTVDDNGDVDYSNSGQGDVDIDDDGDGLGGGEIGEVGEGQAESPAYNPDVVLDDDGNVVDSGNGNNTSPLIVDVGGSEAGQAAISEGNPAVRENGTPFFPSHPRDTHHHRSRNGPIRCTIGQPYFRPSHSTLSLGIERLWSQLDQVGSYEER